MPGLGVVHEYYGCVEQSFELRLGAHFCFVITGLCILEHPQPVVLLGIDMPHQGC